MWADWFGKEFTSTKTVKHHGSDFPPWGLHWPDLGTMCLLGQLMCSVALTSIYIISCEWYTVFYVGLLR